MPPFTPLEQMTSWTITQATNAVGFISNPGEDHLFAIGPTVDNKGIIIAQTLWNNLLNQTDTTAYYTDDILNPTHLVGTNEERLLIGANMSPTASNVGTNHLSFAVFTVAQSTPPQLAWHVYLSDFANEVILRSLTHHSLTHNVFAAQSLNGDTYFGNIDMITPLRPLSWSTAYTISSAVQSVIPVSNGASFGVGLQDTQVAYFMLNSQGQIHYYETISHPFFQPIIAAKATPIVDSTDVLIIAVTAASNGDSSALLTVRVNYLDGNAHTFADVALLPDIFMPELHHPFDLSMAAYQDGWAIALSQQPVHSIGENLICYLDNAGQMTTQPCLYQNSIQDPLHLTQIHIRDNQLILSGQYGIKSPQMAILHLDSNGKPPQLCDGFKEAMPGLSSPLRVYQTSGHVDVLTRTLSSNAAGISVQYRQERNFLLCAELPTSVPSYTLTSSSSAAPSSSPLPTALRSQTSTNQPTSQSTDPSSTITPIPSPSNQPNNWYGWMIVVFIIVIASAIAIHKYHKKSSLLERWLHILKRIEGLSDAEQAFDAMHALPPNFDDVLSQIQHKLSQPTWQETIEANPNSTAIAQITQAFTTIRRLLNNVQQATALLGIKAQLDVILQQINQIQTTVPSIPLLSEPPSPSYTTPQAQALRLEITVENLLGSCRTHTSPQLEVQRKLSFSSPVSHHFDTQNPLHGLWLPIFLVLQASYASDASSSDEGLSIASSQHDRQQRCFLYQQLSVYYEHKGWLESRHHLTLTQFNQRTQQITFDANRLMTDYEQLLTAIKASPPAMSLRDMLGALTSATLSDEVRQCLESCLLIDSQKVQQRSFIIELIVKYGKYRTINHVLQKDNGKFLNAANTDKDNLFAEVAYSLGQLRPKHHYTASDVRKQYRQFSPQTRAHSNVCTMVATLANLFEVSFRMITVDECLFSQSMTGFRVSDQSYCHIKQQWSAYGATKMPESQQVITVAVIDDAILSIPAKVPQVSASQGEVKSNNRIPIGMQTAWEQLFFTPEKRKIYTRLSDSVQAYHEDNQALQPYFITSPFKFFSQLKHLLSPGSSTHNACRASVIKLLTGNSSFAAVLNEQIDALSALQSDISSFRENTAHIKDIAQEYNQIARTLLRGDQKTVFITKHKITQDFNHALEQVITTLGNDSRMLFNRLTVLLRRQYKRYSSLWIGFLHSHPRVLHTIETHLPKLRQLVYQAKQCRLRQLIEYHAPFFLIPLQTHLAKCEVHKSTLFTPNHPNKRFFCQLKAIVGVDHMPVYEQVIRAICTNPSSQTDTLLQTLLREKPALLDFLLEQTPKAVQQWCIAEVIQIFVQNRLLLLPLFKETPPSTLKERLNHQETHQWFVSFFQAVRGNSRFLSSIHVLTKNSIDKKSLDSFFRDYYATNSRDSIPLEKFLNQPERFKRFFNAWSDCIPPQSTLECALSQITTQKCA